MADQLGTTPGNVSRWERGIFRRNPLFTGREDLLAQLHTLLGTGTTTALTQAQALSRLGGIGKTQTAIEYTYRHCDDYSAVLRVVEGPH